MQAEVAEEAPRFHARQRAQAHARVGDEAELHQRDQDRGHRDRADEALGALRARHRHADQQRDQHDDERAHRHLAVVAPRLDEVEAAQVVEVGEDVGRLRRADQAGDQDRHHEAPHQHRRREVPHVAAHQAGGERGRHHHVEGVERRDAEHRVRQEVGRHHRQQHDQRDRADPVVGHHGRAEDDGQRDVEGVGFAKGDRHAARRAEADQADRGEDPDVAADCFAAP